ncbi:hypothetical protein [uncultured Tenacibaculum sp.]|uniref:hypothetical protein n=1 Tax=uncultured Tenacibaculum sp. TaxID=174713 RepID=UPI002623AA30|nr:hypothetical protein [uncultured Tenacibaculum sp.]
MKGFKSIISITIYLFFTVGFLGILRAVILQIKTGTTCPKVQEIPVCYVVFACFITALISHVTKKRSYFYFISIGFALLIATTATIMHIKGDFVCPKTLIKGTPKCYYAVALLSSLIILKILHLRDIEKDFNLNPKS